jgi:hypothetical protein
VEREQKVALAPLLEEIASLWLLKQTKIVPATYSRDSMVFEFADIGCVSSFKYHYYCTESSKCDYFYELYALDNHADIIANNISVTLWEGFQSVVRDLLEISSSFLLEEEISKISKALNSSKSIVECLKMCVTKILVHPLVDTTFEGFENIKVVKFYALGEENVGQALRILDGIDCESIVKVCFQFSRDRACTSRALARFNKLRDVQLCECKLDGIDLTKLLTKNELFHVYLRDLDVENVEINEIDVPYVTLYQIDLSKVQDAFFFNCSELRLIEVEFSALCHVSEGCQLLEVRKMNGFCLKEIPTSVKFLKIGEFEFKEQEALDRINKELHGLKQLEYLSLSSCWGAKFKGDLQEFGRLKTLVLDEYGAMARVAIDNLEHFKSIVRLSLRKNRLENQDLAMIASKLSQVNVKVINLSYNLINRIDVFIPPGIRISVAHNRIPLNIENNEAFLVNDGRSTDHNYNPDVFIDF